MPTTSSLPSDSHVTALPVCQDMLHELEMHPNLDEQVMIMEHHLDLLQTGIEQLQRALHVVA